VVFDTSLSMHASAGPGKPTRLARAKRIAIRLQRSLADVPMGIASMTDRALPNIMPTTDSTLFRRTVEQAIHVDEPPPSQQYRTRATTFTALVPLVESRFFAQKVQRRLVIVLTDGESTKISPLLTLTLHRRVSPVFVHVWQPGERIYHGGRADPRYAADPSSARALDQLARITGGPREFEEHDVAAAARAARDAVGRAGTRTHVDAYAPASCRSASSSGGGTSSAGLRVREVRRARERLPQPLVAGDAVAVHADRLPADADVGRRDVRERPRAVRLRLQAAEADRHRELVQAAEPEPRDRRRPDLDRPGRPDDARRREDDRERADVAAGPAECEARLLRGGRRGNEEGRGGGECERATDHR